SERQNLLGPRPNAALQLLRRKPSNLCAGAMPDGKRQNETSISREKCEGFLDRHVIGSGVRCKTWMVGRPQSTTPSRGRIECYLCGGLDTKTSAGEGHKLRRSLLVHERPLDARLEHRLDVAEAKRFRESAGGLC